MISQPTPPTKLKRYDKQPEPKYEICECGHISGYHFNDDSNDKTCSKCLCPIWNPLSEKYTANEIITMRQQAGIKS